MSIKNPPPLRRLAAALTLAANALAASTAAHA